MPPNRDYPGLHVAGYIIFWCSGFINPIIYTASNKYYRRSLLESLGCCQNFEPLTTTTGVSTNPRRWSARWARKISNQSAATVAFDRKEEADQMRPEQHHN
jgi:hypothetical protein